MKAFRHAALAIAFLLLVGSATSAEAQNGLAVKVQPSIIDEQSDPGGTAEGVFTVTNENGGTQTYYLGTRNIETMDESGRPLFSDIPNDDPHRAASWIKLNQSSVVLDVGQTASVPYTISVPVGAAPGSYAAAIFVTREADEVQGSGAGVGFQVASLLNLRVSGDAEEGMLVREFYAKKAFYTGANVEFEALLENTGNVYQRPQAIIVVYDMLGNEVGQVQFIEEGAGVLPYSDRFFTSRWNSDRFSLGRYTAKASILYGETERWTVTRDTAFWIVPVKELGIALGVLAAVILLIMFALRAYVRRALKQAGHISRTKDEGASVSFTRRLMRTLTILLILMTLLFIMVIVSQA